MRKLSAIPFVECENRLQLRTNGFVEPTFFMSFYKLLDCGMAHTTIWRNTATGKPQWAETWPVANAVKGFGSHFIRRASRGRRRRFGVIREIRAFIGANPFRCDGFSQHRHDIRHALAKDYPTAAERGP
jgi:hypothetical protein